MKRKTKISMLIIIIYFISLFLFEFFIGAAGITEYMEECIEKDIFNVLAPSVTIVEAGILHFILVLIIAIICSFIKEIDKTYKCVIWTCPILTFISSFPMGLVAVSIASNFSLFGL